MRCFDQGCDVRVTVSAREVRDFMDRWPCSNLDPDHNVCFIFSKATEDLVEIFPDDIDGEDVLALSYDAQEYLGLWLERRKTRHHDDHEAHARTLGNSPNCP